MNTGSGDNDLWIIKSESESWQQAVSRYRSYPDETAALLSWAIEEDKKRLLGASYICNKFFIPADLTPSEASDESVQHRANIEKAEQVRREAEREAELERLRAEFEYRHKYLQPGVPKSVRDLAAVELMNSEQLEDLLLPEILEKQDPAVVNAICERYLILEGVTEKEVWENL